MPASQPDPHALAKNTLPEPHQAAEIDQPRDILAFAVERLQRGERCVLVTLTGIVDGAARALGAHMVVASDGGYCGYISGGCVEAAVAREALLALTRDSDSTLHLGKGSDIFDIVLPCGGGILLALHVLRGAAALEDVLVTLDQRESISLAYDPQAGLFVRPGSAPVGWADGRFITSYQPLLQVQLLGQGIEARHFTSLATAAGIAVEPVSPRYPPEPALLDSRTAVVLLQHDIDQELPLLRVALASQAFYIGCLGSKRTHQQRCEALLDDGWTATDLRRLRAPIGLFGPARDARSIAVSVLAEILALSQGNFA